MKKEYISPDSCVVRIRLQQMIAGSQLDQSQDSQTITPTDEEYDDKFTSRRHRSVWDEEEEFEE